MGIQSAKKEDAANLAHLINLAGEGIPKFLWSEMADEGQSPMDVGCSRASREEGGFSYLNARTFVENDVLQGMIISYKQPDSYPLDDIEEYPEVVRPLVSLEAKACGSWYINAIATFENYQGKGIARKLLLDAEERAISSGCSEMSLIVASENIRAKQLYEHLEYHTVSSLPVVDYPGSLHGGEWLLMVKQLK